MQIRKDEKIRNLLRAQGEIKDDDHFREFSYMEDRELME